MRFLHIFIVIFSLLSPAYAFAADSIQNLDIPDSEPSDEEVVPDNKAIPESVKEPQNANDNKAAETAPADENQQEPNMLVLQGLNKVVGRVSRLEIPLGAMVRFENLEIIARKCWKSPPDERPENAALLEIREVKAGEEPKQIFLGWMFSSSPGLSALEHPVYDVTVLSCEYRKDLEIN